MPVSFNANFQQGGTDRRTFYILPWQARAFVVSEDRTDIFLLTYSELTGKVIFPVPYPYNSQCSVDGQGAITLRPVEGVVTVASYQNGHMRMEQYYGGHEPGQDSPDLVQDMPNCIISHRDVQEVFSREDVDRLVKEYPMRAYAARRRDFGGVSFLVSCPDLLYYPWYNVTNRLEVSVDGGAWVWLNIPEQVSPGTGTMDDVDYAAIGDDGLVRWVFNATPAEDSSYNALDGLDLGSGHDLAFRLLHQDTGEVLNSCTMRYEP